MTMKTQHEALVKRIKYKDLNPKSSYHNITITYRNISESHLTTLLNYCDEFTLLPTKKWCTLHKFTVNYTQHPADVMYSPSRSHVSSLFSVFLDCEILANNSDEAIDQAQMAMAGCGDLDISYIFIR